ncbi:hypothetical protein XV41_00760 [Salmonella enterica subsp. enterica serovar Enteritidis]|nr:hypothetical protein [Salmonella enterica subsp. enterica serovar Enteritidis]EDU8832773.1 hypothetical protein [Salmonella enterica subsp. enterica]EEM6850016.1 hypothetical protein [Salmonella enterica subsp. enterica serovar Montevideo]HEI2719178.1 hypothetical protein [Escherichia coli]EEB4832862.1 hypothetical protein [Salmonella enterica subsp. enterica serovar Enteritidis]
MKIDLEIMKTIFNVLIDSPDVFIKNTELSDAVPDENALYFHFLLMLDNGFITGTDLLSTPESTGVHSGRDKVSFRCRYIRLSQRGLDFANALNQPKIMTRLKKICMDASMDILVSTGKSLMSNWIQDQLHL